MAIFDYNEAQAAAKLSEDGIGPSARMLAKWRRAGLIPYSTDFSGRIGYTAGQLSEIANLCRRLPSEREPDVIR